MTCDYSGLPVTRCKASDLCDCFTDGKASCCSLAPFCGHEPNLPPHLEPEPTLLEDA